MGIALWCEVKDKGHAFDEREAIVVNHADDPQYFCKAHCIPAFVTAFHFARANGHADIFLPTLGGAFTITPGASISAPSSQQHAGDSTGDSGNAVDGQAQSASQAARSGKGKPSRGGRSRETGQAIAEMLEQMPSRIPAASAPANYGGRA